MNNIYISNDFFIYIDYGLYYNLFLINFKETNIFSEYGVSYKRQLIKHKTKDVYFFNIIEIIKNIDTSEKNFN